MSSPLLLDVCLAFAAAVFVIMITIVVRRTHGRIFRWSRESRAVSNSLHYHKID
jgi:hypothetical protein